MDNKLKALELHDCLHGFTAGRGTGPAIMEAKLSQQLAFIEQMLSTRSLLISGRHLTQWTGGHA